MQQACAGQSGGVLSCAGFWRCGYPFIGFMLGSSAAVHWHPSWWPALVPGQSGVGRVGALDRWAGWQCMQRGSCHQGVVCKHGAEVGCSCNMPVLGRQDHCGQATWPLWGQSGWQLVALLHGVPVPGTYVYMHVLLWAHNMRALMSAML